MIFEEGGEVQKQVRQVVIAVQKVKIVQEEGQARSRRKQQEPENRQRPE